MNVKNVSRVMGVIWISISILWAGLGIAGILYGSNWLESVQSSLDDNLILMADSLESIRILAEGTTDVVSSTHQSLMTAQVSVQDASVALEDLRPVLSKTTNVVTLEVPSALDGLQNSMPSLISHQPRASPLLPVLPVGTTIVFPQPYPWMVRSLLTTICGPSAWVIAAT